MGDEPYSCSLFNFVQLGVERGNELQLNWKEARKNVRQVRYSSIRIPH